tara:strand:- start:374 stop:874 length:501 start_codon:yes stop_codon:yes gene_type:complete
MFKLIVFFIVLIFTSCGFKPIYKTNEKLLNYKIQVIVKNREENKNARYESQIVEKYIKQKINKKSSKISSLKLIVLIKRSQGNLGLQKDLSTTKYKITYTADYIFYDKMGTITKGNLEKFSSFDLGENSYSNLIAESDTNENILKSLSQEIVNLILSINIERKIYP